MSEQIEGVLARSEQGAIDASVWRVASTVIIGAAAVVFDTTIVSVAINDLVIELDAPLSTVQWVSSGYLLAMLFTLPVAGWAQSAFGGKRLWLAALATFLFGSILCACAWDVTSLIVFRVVQGIGGGILMPLMMTLIMQAAGGRQVGRVMAALTLPTALGPVIGPVLGGVMVSVGDWRWMFLLNVPFCVIGGLLAVKNLPDDRPSAHGALDWVGLLVLSPGVASLTYGLSEAAAVGWGSAHVLVSLLGGAALVAGFIAWASARRSRALVDLTLFRHRPLSAASALGFLTGGALLGTMLLLPLYWQRVRGTDALGAGMLLIPQGLGTLLSRRFAGRLTDEVGPRYVALVGFAVVTAATIPFGFVTDHTSKELLLAALFVRGLGLGTATIPLTATAYVGLRGPEIPSASIITRVAQQLGGSIGTALLAVILQTATTSLDVAGGFRIAFWCAVSFTAIAIPLSLLLPVGRTNLEGE